MSGKDSAVSSEDLVDQKDGLSDEEIYTELSLHPTWQISQEEQYVLRFLNNDLAPLKPNQISLAGIEISKENEKIIATAFIRSSLSKPIRLKDTTLLLLDEEGTLIARKQFDLSSVGEIPPRSSRPWKFPFEAKLLQIPSENIPKEGWQLAFELKPKHRLDLEESWEKGLSAEDKEKLQQVVEKAGAPKDGEVNFLGLSASRDAEENLRITLLIRNGCNKGIKIEQLPLEIIDASGEVVAKGTFKLNDLEVKAFTSKPWSFIFPKEMVIKENPDLSQWKAVPIQ